MKFVVTPKNILMTFDIVLFPLVLPMSVMHFAQEQCDLQRSRFFFQLYPLSYFEFALKPFYE
jgi:hypothetical protein